jgi:predicted RNA binding protein YcfA (HicA-like mRNA interferase family)
MKVKELIKTIELDGWVQVRMRGSHRQFRHSNKPGTVTISGKPNIDVPPGTLNSALKQAGLK